jgi:hypothetical protein
VDATSRFDQHEKQQQETQKEIKEKKINETQE